MISAGDVDAFRRSVRPRIAPSFDVPGVVFDSVVDELGLVVVVEVAFGAFLEVVVEVVPSNFKRKKANECQTAGR